VIGGKNEAPCFGREGRTVGQPHPVLCESRNLPPPHRHPAAIRRDPIRQNLRHKKGPCPRRCLVGVLVAAPGPIREGDRRWRLLPARDSQLGVLGRETVRGLKRRQGGGGEHTSSGFKKTVAIKFPGKKGGWNKNIRISDSKRPKRHEGKYNVQVAMAFPWARYASSMGSMKKLLCRRLEAEVGALLQTPPTTAAHEAEPQKNHVLERRIGS